MRERTNEARLILKEIKTLSDFLRNYAKGTKKGTKQFVLRPSFDFAVLLTPGSLRFPMGMSSSAELFLLLFYSSITTIFASTAFLRTDSIPLRQLFIAL